MNIASTEANNKLREAKECFFDNVSLCVALAKRGYLSEDEFRYQTQIHAKCFYNTIALVITAEAVIETLKQIEMENK